MSQSLDKKAGERQREEVLRLKESVGNAFRLPDERAVPSFATPDYGAELYLRFVEDIIKRLTDKEWERVKKSRDGRVVSSDATRGNT